MAGSSPGNQQPGEGSSSYAAVSHQDDIYQNEATEDSGNESALLAGDPLEDHRQAQYYRISLQLEGRS